jgi:hypothetical protein
VPRARFLATVAPDSEAPGSDAAVGESNGCVVFKNYNAFLQAFQKGQVKRLIVVDNLKVRKGYDLTLAQVPFEPFAVIGPEQSLAPARGAKLSYENKDNLAAQEAVR